MHSPNSPSTATKHVLDVLQDITSYLGIPDRIVTDRGTAFTSKDFEKYGKSNNVKHILNAVRTPRANGHAERTNRIILSMLLPSNDIDKRWDDNIRSIQWSINTMVNSTTKCSPFQLLYRRSQTKMTIWKMIHPMNPARTQRFVRRGRL